MADAHQQSAFFDETQFQALADRFIRDSMNALGDLNQFQSLLTQAVQGEDGESLSMLMDTLRQQVEQFYDQQLQLIEATPMPAEAFISFAGQMLSALPSGNWLNQIMPVSPLSDAMMPKLGLFQDRQAQLERASEALKQLREAQVAYSDHLRLIALDSLKEFEKRIKALPEDHQASLKELYQIWLDASERSYERHMVEESYAQALGQLTNASMAAQGESQKMVDDMLEAMHLPSKREMVSTQKRMNDIRRRQHNLAEQLEDSDIQSLRDEIATLRAELNALKSS